MSKPDKMSIGSRRKMVVMNSIFRSILSAESIEDRIHITIREFAKNFSFAKVSIILVDFKKATFTYYNNNDEQNVNIVLKDGTVFPLEQFNRLPELMEHKTCLIDDLTTVENISPLEKNILEVEGIVSYFLCPLVAKGELIGSLNFSSNIKHAFSTELISFCEEIAYGIAISLYQYFLQEKIKTINAELEKKDKSITDSFVYAKRIQDAKLPSRQQISAVIPDSFVLFKPKDIVSGDFYYFRKVKEAVFVAAADCTGHGVPGALMSMICSENLDDAISQSSDTSAILEQVNKKIKYSLQQSDSAGSTRDGMDIALCNIDINNSIVKFAGANRPIWIIRSGSSDVEEIKGTKKGIGGLSSENTEFATHWIKFRKGDTFYLTTDGYADTYGGKSKKKLMTRRFKELLVSIKDRSMEDQKNFLDDFIENWKGDLEQIDDILVIGVKI